MSVFRGAGGGGNGGGGGGAANDRELLTLVYRVTTAFAGAGVGDLVTSAQVVDVDGAPSTIAVLWRNQTTGADLGGAPAMANLLPLGTFLLRSDGSLVDTNDAARVISPPAGAPIDITIPNGQTNSNAVDLDTVAARAHRISFPAGFAWTAAQLTIQVSHDGVAWNALFRLNDDGTATATGIAQTAQIVAGRSLLLPPEIFFGVRHIRFVSSVAQAAARTFQLVTVPR